MLRQRSINTNFTSEDVSSSNTQILRYHLRLPRGRQTGTERGGEGTRTVYARECTLSLFHGPDNLLDVDVGWEKSTDEPIFNGSWEREPTNGSQRILTVSKIG
jgi:hypothetical protein